MKHERLQSSRQRVTVLVLGFLFLGFFSACSQVKREVINSKQASAADRTKIYGQDAGSTKADRSLWSVSHRDIN